MLIYDQYVNIVESNLSSYIPDVDDNSSVLRDSMLYSLTGGGKRLRPVLLLASCDLAGGDIDDAIPYAIALECIHTYSLIHDDLPAMDDDDLRRGKPTNHKVYGEAIAILAGDGLLNTAAEIMLSDIVNAADSAKDTNSRIKAAHAIIKAAGIRGMIAGQVCDILNESNEATSETVDFIEKNKTGALIKAPIVAGLSIAGADAETTDKLSHYADRIGTAFQISDDILDFTSTPEELGKSIGKDKEQGKCNYVMVHGMDMAVAKLRELTDEAIVYAEKCGQGSDFFVDLARKLENRRV